MSLPRESIRSKQIYDIHKVANRNAPALPYMKKIVVYIAEMFV